MPRMISSMPGEVDGSDCFLDHHQLEKEETAVEGREQEEQEDQKEYILEKTL